MKKTLTVFLISTFLIISFSCNNGIVDPPEDQPGRRDYVWEVDTMLHYSYMGRIWGSSPRDIWAVGEPGDFSKTFWHYDGYSWTTDDVFRLVSPTSIYGFSQNNIWVGAGNGKIWHYNGSRWQKNAQFTQNGNTLIIFDGMWGESPNNLYAFGAFPDEKLYLNNSVIARYTNNNWTMLNTEGLTGIVERFYKNNSDDKFYLRTNKLGAGEFPDSTLIYEYYEGEYKKIYGSRLLTGEQADLCLINGEVYFVLGNEIAKRVNNKLETFLTVDYSNFYQRIWGKNSKDIFLLMTDGLAHYNGTNIEYLFYFNKPRTQIYKDGTALFKDEVFFFTVEAPSGLYLIYHGRLKNGG